MLHPFIKTVSKAVNQVVADSHCEFYKGETQLNAMTKQLKSLGLQHNDKCQYNTDALIKLFGLDKLEILLLETSGHFGNKEESKICFDHHKGLFGALAMFKTIADEYHLVSMELFKDVKVFFVHGSGTVYNIHVLYMKYRSFFAYQIGRSVHLWSLRFVPEGEIFELWLDTSLEIDPRFEKRDEILPAFINVYWTMLVSIMIALLDIYFLKHVLMVDFVEFVKTICRENPKVKSEP